LELAPRTFSQQPKLEAYREQARASRAAIAAAVRGALPGVLSSVREPDESAPWSKELSRR